MKHKPNRKTEGPRSMKDEFGFALGSKRSKAAGMFASPTGATMKEVEKALGDSQYNIFPFVKNRGFEVERIGKHYRITGADSPSIQKPHVEWTQVDPNGRVVIPAAFRQRLGIGPGDWVQMRIVEDELRLIGRDQAFKRAQALVAKYVPEGESLVDALIAERRLEAARE